MLDGDNHDNGGKHRARQVCDERQQCQDGHQQQRRVDQDRNPRVAAEGSVGDARANIDAAGDAADGGRRCVSEAEPHEQVVAVTAWGARGVCELGAEHAVNRCDGGKRQRAGEDDKGEACELTQRGGVDELGVGLWPRDGHGWHADGGAKRGRHSCEHQAVVGGDADPQSYQQWRHLGGDPPRVPHGDEGDGRDRNAKGLRLRELAERAGHWHTIVVAQDVAKLHQEQQHCRHILESSHHGMRRELDQRAELEQSEQRLQQAGKQDDDKQHEEAERHGRRLQCGLGRMHQRIKQKP